MVIVDGKEETHTEGAHNFQAEGGWERVSEFAAEAQQEQKKRLARQRYQQETPFLNPKPRGFYCDGQLTSISLDLNSRSPPRTVSSARRR